MIALVAAGLLALQTPVSLDAVATPAPALAAEALTPAASATSATASPSPAPTTAQPDQPPVKAHAFKDLIVRLAVEEAHKAKAEPQSRTKELAFSATSADQKKYEKFAEMVADARVPDCLHSEGLKFQPPVIGFIGLTSLFAAPFVLLAAVRGKCH